MKLIELVTGPWAILPAHLLEMQEIYSSHLRGDKIDIATVEARLGRPLSNEQKTYEVVDGVAVLPVEGVIAPKANFFMQISGGASTQMLQRQVETAMGDRSVRSMILAIDSPGGSVYGTPELARTIFEASKTKPIVSYSDATMASAAYWIGSAANAVYISGPTVDVGSIGVVAKHIDVSKQRAARGEIHTEITSGKYKRIASDNGPLTAEGEASLQAKTDYLYSLFTDVVAQHRGTDVGTVLELMADGRVFIGQQAIDAGLVDGVSTLDQLVAQMAAEPGRFANRKKVGRRTSAPRSTSAGAALQDASPAQEPLLLAGDQPPTERTIVEDTKPTLTRESLERDHTALFAQLRTEFTNAGAAGERERVAAVRAAALPGHEKLIETLAADGTTTGDQAARAVLAAERTVRGDAARAHAADAPPAAPASNAPNDAKPDARSIAAGAVALFRNTRAQGAKA